MFENSEQINTMPVNYIVTDNEYDDNIGGK